jgi:hypothetical protein
MIGTSGIDDVIEMSSARFANASRWPLAAILALAFAPATAAQAPDAIAARVLSVHCDAKLVRSGSKNEVTLISPRDVALGLAAGDRIYCAKPGYLEMLVAEGLEKVTETPKLGYTVKPLPADPKYSENQQIVQALTEYGVSGATRGQAADSRILWPSDGAAVSPADFKILWTPLPKKISLAILSEAKDATLWGPAEVDGGAGELQSAAISAALDDYQKKSAEPALVLTLQVGDAADWDEMHFSLLSGKLRQELNAQLGFWAAQPDEMAAHLGRGYCFLRYKLYAEAAAEYDAALNSAPGSGYLLDAAIRANRLAGRASRVKKLQSQRASPQTTANP